nr:auxin-responsive protein IAA13 isoform X2 [Tanacetum cinerariifolium]
MATTNFSGAGAGSVSSDTTVETTNKKVMAHNEVSSPINILQSGVPVGEHSRSLTAMDPTHVASSSLARNVSATPPSVVGRPPIATHILNNQNASPEIGHETSNGAVLVNNNGDQHVKVFMDGRRLGQRVNLSAHHSYEELTQTLDGMFRECGLNTEGVGPSYLLSGQFEYVLTFQDQEGDLMFAADYLWPEFQRLVKKIRITKNPEFLRLGYHERAVEAAASEESRTTDNI